MNESVLVIKKLGKCYISYRNNIERFMSWFGFTARHTKNYWAIKNVSFTLRRGEAIGLIGRNGAGKSTLLKLITGTIRQTDGTVVLKGSVSAILELGLGFNQDFTGIQNVYLAGGMMGLSTDEIEYFIPEIKVFSELGDFFEQPLRIYSSGMQARLAFALATCKKPDLLIVDEALSVGDIGFQRKCFRRIEGYLSSGTALLFVSHDIESVRRLCSHALFLKNGEVSYFGESNDACAQYEQDLFGAISAPVDVKPYLVADEVCSENFDEHLDSSPEVSYGDGRAEIFDRWVEDSSGKRINILYHNQPISWCFKIRFKDDLKSFVIAMRIKTVEGIGVFGSHKNYVISVRSGTEVIVKISLINHLSPGVYFLNCAILDESSDEGKFLHRRVDTYAIRVNFSGDETFEGLVNMEPKFNLSFSGRKE